MSECCALETPSRVHSLRFCHSGCSQDVPGHEEIAWAMPIEGGVHLVGLEPLSYRDRSEPRPNQTEITDRMAMSVANLAREFFLGRYMKAHSMLST